MMVDKSLWVVAASTLLAACTFDPPIMEGDPSAKSLDGSLPGLETGGRDGNAPSSDSGRDTLLRSELHCADFASGLIAGTVQKNAWQENWEVETQALTAGDPWFLLSGFGGRGFEYYQGSSAADPETFLNGAYEVAFGLLWAPESSSQSGNVICFGSGQVVAGERPPLALRSERAKLLDACPGAGVAVQEDLTACSGSCPNFESTITFDAQTLDLDGLGFWARRSETYATITAKSKTFLLTVFADTSLALGRQGEVDKGLLFVYPTADRPGTVYCAGSGSSFAWGTAQGTGVTLKNVTKLGDCSETDEGGKLLVCR